MKRGDSHEPPGVPQGLFQLHRTLDAVSTFLYVKDRERRVVSANQAFCDALGVTRGQLIGSPTTPYLGDSGAESDRIDREVIESGTPHLGFIESFVSAGGGRRWVVTDKAPVRGPDGAVVGLVGASIDITAQRDFQNKLEQREVQLSFITDHMADLLWTMDLQFHTTFVTPSIERVLGFTPEERYQQSLDQMTTRESAARILAELRHQLELEVSGSAERDRTLAIDVEYYRKDGSTAWMETLVHPVRDETGNLVGMAGVSRDITERRKAEEALRLSEARLRLLTENTADVIWTMDLSLRTTYISPSVERLLGFTPEEWLALPFEQMATPESVQREYAELQRQLELERFGAADPDRSLTLEVEMNHKNGATVWMEMVIRAVRDEAGSLTGMVGVSRDISERKKVQEKLRESERLLRETETLSHLGGWSYDVATRKMFWTEGVFAIHEIAPDTDAELVATSVNCYAPEARDAVLEAFHRAIEQGLPYDLEVPFVTAKGAHRWVRTTGHPEFKDGVVVRVTGNIMDVTEQHEAAEQLRASEQRYRQLFEQSVDAVNLVAPDGRLLEANPAWYALFGVTTDDISTYNAREAYVDLDGRQRFLEAIAVQDRVEDEVRFRRKDGTVFDCHRVVTTRRSPDGSVLGYQTVFHDVTEQKRALTALRESEERFRLVLSGSPVIIAQVDRELRYVWIYHPHPDFADSSVLGKRDDELSDNAGTRQMMQLKRQVISTGQPARRTISFPLSVGTRTYDIAAEPLRDESGAVIGATTVSFDITERVVAEEALKASEEKYRQIFDQSVVPISLISMDGRIIEANDAWMSLLGYSHDDIPSFNAVSLFEHPDDRKELIEQLLRNGHLDNYAARIKRKDGTFIDVIRSISVRYNPDGSILGLQTVLRDVTELHRTRDELLASREQLRRLALRIQEAREEERSTIAHDLHDKFSQELTALKFDLESLRRIVQQEGDAVQKRLRDITALVDSMAYEVRRVISEMRPGMLDDLGLCAAVEWQAGQFSERTGIPCALNLTAEDAVLSPAVRTSLFRVFQELLSNVARYAEATEVAVDLVSDAETVSLIVADNGRGITEGELEGPGSLGILGMQERIHACGGSIRIHGEPGNGTTAKVTVPLKASGDSAWQTRLGLP